MSDLSHPAWFVQLDGGISGPITLADMRRLARSRRVVPNTLVSRDGQKWFPAFSLPVLRTDFEGSSRDVPAPPVPPTPILRADSRPLRPVWIAVGILCCIVVLGACVLCIAVLSNLEKSSSNAAAPSSGRTSDSAGGLSQAGASTAVYWLSVQREVAQIPQVKNTAELTVIATRLERLPVVDIDPDLIQFTIELASLIRDSAQQVQRQKDPDLFLETIVRGVSGDPLGTLNEQRRAQNGIFDRWTAMQSYAARLRATLSQRYGVEFPPF